MSDDGDQRAMVAGYRAMLARAEEALLYIENECGSKDECVAAAKEALDELGRKA